MRPVRLLLLLLLPIVLPAALWACTAEPSGVSVRLQGREALFAAPPGLPPGPGPRPCHQQDRPAGEVGGQPGSHALEVLLPPGQA